VSTYECSHFENVSGLVQAVQETEHKYLLHGPRHDPVVTPWMPYQPADFIGILWECVPEMKGSFFLDVGCGPGTKMRIAQTLFGMNVRGVEINSDMADEARKYFNDPGAVVTGDALQLLPDYHPFDVFDLVWLYRPFRDPVSETRLEQKITDSMKPGAILAGSGWEIDPAGLGWQPIVDDCMYSPDASAKIVRGAWQKPAE
jgi:SAM-dependent methyltransferase